MHAYLNDMKNKRVFYKRTDFVNDACEKEREKKYKFSRWVCKIWNEIMHAYLIYNIKRVFD